MMFFKKRKWYLITWKWSGSENINHSTLKALDKASAWYKLEQICTGPIQMVDIKEYEDE